MNYTFDTYTVESVTSGHPDKVCDQISDAILDACLREDPTSRVAVEAFGAHGLLVIGGEITTKAQFNAEKIARDVYSEIGYADELEVITRLEVQSPDIAQGVDPGGAGDQGIMYGYACNETPEYLPQGVVYAHALAEGLELLRKEGGQKWIRPDGKAQVTVVDNRVSAVLVSTQHTEDMDHARISEELREKLIIPVIGSVDNVSVLINPTGKFVIGGFAGDTGLTGRKIMVDTYGGLVPHGGGCFSGKDATKVDRSGAYMTRFVAKNIVANGYAQECLVSVAYAIGKVEPLMVRAIDEKGNDLSTIVAENFDFRPAAIRKRLSLDQPIFSQTAAYGHFGKEDLPWEEIISLSD